MSDVQKPEIVLPQSENPLAVEIMKFLEELDQQEQREFMTFMQGARFAMTLVTQGLTNLLPYGNRETSFVLVSFQYQSDRKRWQHEADDITSSGEIT